MPKVLNRKNLEGPFPEGATFIGRPSKWGNPFSHYPGTLAKWIVGSRLEAVARYREWFLTQPELVAALPELRGRDLVCFCAPLACHGDVLLELANKETP